MRRCATHNALAKSRSVAESNFSALLGVLENRDMPYFYKDVQTTSTRSECTGFECSKCNARYDADNFIEMQESLHWCDTGGYGSVWGDGTKYEITLCQKCAHELLGGIATIHGA